MKIIPPEEGLIMMNAAGVGTVTPEMILARAAEIALINGHTTGDVGELDWEQALQELTVPNQIEPQDTGLEEIPKSEHWGSPPDSSGHIVPVPSLDAEDEEGRCFSERLIQDGLNEADHDQRLQAARDRPEEEESDE